MSYSMYLCVTMATLLFNAPRDADDRPEASLDFDDALKPVLDSIADLVEGFRRSEISPQGTVLFEKSLQGTVRELARLVTEWAYNHVEPSDVETLPPEVRFESSPYRRLRRKTRQEVSTLFGTISLWRLGYRAAPDVGEPVLFPLCQELGFVQGATPALVERVAHYLAESGATQKQTLERLRQEHGVKWGVKRLRQVAEFVAAAMEEHRPAAQTEQVLRWLAQAQASRGRHRPVLSVGRDGITLGLRIKKGSIYEVATVATITVYDRRGRRLGTVYLAYTPEPGQGTIGTQLTSLWQEILRRWQGPLPRLCYVTDAGDNETTYYEKVLRRQRHRGTGQRLDWIRVVDYYHASERLSTMAAALFGKGQRSWTWTRKMQKLLLKPGGVGRVLHSAAALRSRLKLRGNRLVEFKRAYQYLQSRRTYMRYADYRRAGLPIGSGVTEAACKTVFTQRLKLSGMSWKKSGAQTILRLRVILLSGVWSEAYERVLETHNEVQMPTPAQLSDCRAKKAA